MPSITEGKYLSDIVKHEAENLFSRDQVTVLSGQSLAIGAVVGKIAKSCPATGTPGAGNTGNGTCTLVAAGPKALVGTYSLTCTAAAANAGTFAVKAPDGTALPDAQVGAACDNAQIQFTLNDGAVDFAAGDSFTITVAAGSGKVTAIDFGAVDGTQDAAGVTTAAVDAATADKPAVIIARDAAVVESQLTWPGGATAGQKAAAMAQLKALGIVSRTDA